MVPGPGQQMLVIGIRGALLLLAGSLLANIIGFVSLSQVLGFDWPWLGPSWPAPSIVGRES